MTKCIVPNCPNETHKGRLLCPRHYHIGLVESADGLCVKCGLIRCQPGHSLCAKCLRERTDVTEQT